MGSQPPHKQNTNLELIWAWLLIHENTKGQQTAPEMEQDVGLEISRGPLQPKLLCDSVISWST